MKIASLTLTAVAAPRKNNGRVSVITDVRIYVGGDRLVALKTLGGRYDSTTALKEFKKSPERFTLQEGYSLSLVKALIAA